MKNVNRVILVGLVGKDPEVKYTASGIPVGRFSLATNERFKDKSSKFQDRAEWHNIVVWRKLAEIVGEFVSQGSHLYIERKLETTSWEAQKRNPGQRLWPAIWCFWARERREMEPGRLVPIRRRRASQLPEQLVLLRSRTTNFRFELFPALLRLHRDS